MRKYKSVRKTINRMCACNSERRKDWWYLWRVEEAKATVPVQGYVMCRKCGGSWKTNNAYICSLEGSELFKKELEEMTKAELARVESIIGQTQKRIYRLSMMLEIYRERADAMREALKEAGN